MSWPRPIRRPVVRSGNCASSRPIRSRKTKCSKRNARHSRPRHGLNCSAIADSGRWQASGRLRRRSLRRLRIHVGRRSATVWRISKSAGGFCCSNARRCTLPCTKLKCESRTCVARWPRFRPRSPRSRRPYRHPVALPPDAPDPPEVQAAQQAVEQMKQDLQQAQAMERAALTAQRRGTASRYPCRGTVAPSPAPSRANT